MLTTPDLSKEFNPQPKTSKAKKPPKKLGVGVKTKTWNDIREEVKKAFLKRGITECELRGSGCWRNNALTFSHFDKRRFLTKEDLKSVALLCVVCHQAIEQLPREQMKKIVLNIIKNRKVKVSSK